MFAEVISKYILGLAESQTIKVPMGTKFLSVQTLNGDIVLWGKYRVKKSNHREPLNGYKEVNIVMKSTGNSFYNDPSDPLQYIGTVKPNLFVWHIFNKTMNV